MSSKTYNVGDRVRMRCFARTHTIDRIYTNEKGETIYVLDNCFHLHASQLSRARDL